MDPFQDDRDDTDWFDDDFFSDRMLLSKRKPKQSCAKDKCPRKHTDKTEVEIPKLSSHVLRNDDKEFNFAMNIKGYGKKDVSVKVEQNFLKISGNKGGDCKDEKKRCEKMYFRYQYLLPKETDLTKMKATLSKDGFLVVKIPKITKSQHNVIDLNVEETDESYFDRKGEEDRKTEEQTEPKTVKDQAGGKTQDSSNISPDKSRKTSEEEPAATIEVVPWMTCTSL